MLFYRVGLDSSRSPLTRLHQVIAEHLGDTDDDQALEAVGYTVSAVNSLQAARYREHLSVPGAKSDAADVYMPADTVRGC
ncbi:hypothetical protein [Actinomadura macrotermitis]|uniref:Uncharacterized protein n=1 Tax=Actinomadura macrotermitis TaxID=2585200 RepID=A0A7K0BTL2_9ACTN|nr:hypothetical protein [Actinomadura macrotermitis]MQY04533.1 hypothetical protein [Actinomadura macrotermitis]